MYIQDRLKELEKSLASCKAQLADAEQKATALRHQFFSLNGAHQELKKLVVLDKKLIPDEVSIL